MALRVYFDYVSPYAYIAWHQLPAIAARHAQSIEPVPVVFGALLGAHGTRGPAEVPAKRRYILKDAYRKARRAGLPLTLPPTKERRIGSRSARLRSVSRGRSASGTAPPP